MRTVLVTGGCGFIGSHFVRLLLERRADRVVNLDKLTYAGDPERLAGVEEGARYRLVRGDIADRDLVAGVFAEERPDAVVNFAAESHVDRSIADPEPFLRTNLLGVQVLLEAARRHPVRRFLQVSTDEVYGDGDGLAPFDEASPLRPGSPYAASKAAADLLCLAYRRTYGVPVLIVRSSNNYGPLQFPEKLIPFTIWNAVRGAPLPVYGDGAQRREWLHVEDNVRAILRVLERGEVGAVYNVGSGDERGNLEVVRSICRLLAEQAGFDPGDLARRVSLVADRPGHDRRYALDSRKIRRELGWSPEIPFGEGLAATVRWYLEHGDWVDRVALREHRAS